LCAPFSAWESFIGMLAPSVVERLLRRRSASDELAGVPASSKKVGRKRRTAATVKSTVARCHVVRLESHAKYSTGYPACAVTALRQRGTPSFHANEEGVR
jgi:hypothetical protein